MKNKNLSFSTILFIATVCMLSAFFISSCQKDEIETDKNNTTSQVETRSTSVDIVFFKSSLTTDNYLVADNNTIFRSYKIFNAAKIDSIEMFASNLPDINSGGVVLKHYKIRVNFNDSTEYYFSGHSKPVGNQFTFTPYGENQLRDLHSAKYLDITVLGRDNSSQLYNLWRDQSFTPLEWEIKKDGSIFITKSILYPLDKTSNIFKPKMVH